MKKQKLESGITLVALILTIVILIILAIVAVTSINQYYLIEKAKGAVATHTDKVEEEQGVLESLIDQYLGDKPEGDNTESGDVTLVGREGQTVKYDCNNDGIKEDWIILTDRDGLVEIVSAEPMGSLKIGGHDPEIKGNLLKYLDLDNNGIPDDFDGDGVIEEGGVDYNKDGKKSSDEHDIAIASYNNAITTINNYCKSLVTATDNEGVRSVGGTNNNFTAYSSTNYNNWGSKITVDVAAEDDYHKKDFDKMKKLEIYVTDKNYWWASRRSIDHAYAGYISFGVWCLVDGFSGSYTWTVRNDGNISCNSTAEKGVRPVIINPDGI